MWLSGCVPLNPPSTGIHGRDYERPRRSASSTRRRTASSWPTRRRTSTPWPAHAATWGATPPLSRVDTVACRRSYERVARGEAFSSAVSAAARACPHTRPYRLSEIGPPRTPRNSRPSGAVLIEVRAQVRGQLWRTRHHPDLIHASMLRLARLPTSVGRAARSAGRRRRGAQAQLAPAGRRQRERVVAEIDGFPRPKRGVVRDAEQADHGRSRGQRCHRCGECPGLGVVDHDARLTDSVTLEPAI